MGHLHPERGDLMAVSEKRRIRCVFIGFCVWVMPLLTIGCAAEARFVRTAPDPKPAIIRAPEQVVVWPAATAAGRPVAQIGIIEGESGAAPPLTGDHSQEPMIEIRKEAGLRGCDAVVPSPAEKRIYATSNGTPLYRFHQRAACFVYLPGNPASPGQPSNGRQNP
jgi:hypothetical protein